MRALQRRFVVPLILAAALVPVSLSVHSSSKPAHIASPVSQICPAGTNWDNIVTCP